MNNTITVKTVIKKDIGTVWNFFNDGTHIKKWMHASDDWECTDAANNPTVGGHFVYVLAAKDGSVSFELPGTYTLVKEYEELNYTLNDGRKVSLTFTQETDGVHVVETFEMEQENTEALQRLGWQAILDNFKKYTENYK